MGNVLEGGPAASGDGDNLPVSRVSASPLGEALLDKVKAARADLFGQSYATEDLDELKFTGISHMLSRGHEGRVLCINASTTTDYIVSGGADHTMRIWAYDGSKTVYEFEIDGQRWSGIVNKEADGDDKNEDSSGNLPMTHQLKLHRVVGGRVDTTFEAEYLWVRMDGGTLWCESSKDGIPFTKTVTQEATDSFRLHAVLMHDVEQEENRRLAESLEEADEEQSDPSKEASQSRGVTAVACAGMVGPCISGTSNGSMHFMRLPKAGGDVVSIRDLGVGGINDLDVAELEDPTQEGGQDASLVGPWIIAIAGHAGKLVLMRLSTRWGMEWSQHCEPLEHDHPVLKVRQVRDAGPLGVRFASCAGAEVYLWTLDGSPLTRLSFQITDGVPQPMMDLTVTNRDSGTLLFAGSKGYVGVWVIDPAESELPADPLTIYSHSGSGIDVDQGSDMAEYAVHIREAHVMVTWKLLAASPESLINPLSISKWWQLLIKPGRERIVTEMVHQSPVTDFKVAEDDVEGPVLLSASADGTVYTWSMKKCDRGEIIAQMRSLKLWEVALPPFLLMMTVCQWCSFAFGPSTSWRRGVKETVKYGVSIIFFGADLSIELDIKNSDKFRWELAIVLRIMLTFIFCEVVGLYELLANAQNAVQSSVRFKEEDQSGKLPVMHLLRLQIRLVQKAQLFMSWCCCTVGVAPVFKVVAQSMRCSKEQDGDQYFLDIAGGRSVECLMFLDVPVWLRWDGHGDSSFSPFLILLLALVYFVGLMPYAVVGGDCSYVQRDEIFSYKAWESNAERKATALNLGIFHPNPRHVFKAQSAELASKAFLPMITWLVSEPRLQMSLSTLLMALLFAESMLFPALLDKMHCRVVQGARLFALGTMLCGLITTVLGNRHSWLPVLLLFVNFVSVCALTTYRVRNVKFYHRKVHHKSTRQSADVPDM